jgi:bacillithiol synthase
MNHQFSTLPYHQAGPFSKIVLDYLNESPAIQPFYAHPVSTEGMRAAIRARKQSPVNRDLLVDVLRKQYQDMPLAKQQEVNLNQLGNTNSFTICTAHQPNIFTGYLYFVYKILHTIQLSRYLKTQFADCHFVPVFYMGSEDNDLDELGNIKLNGEKLVWDTPQQGAVGRMSTKGLDTLIERIGGQLSFLPYGAELMALLKDCYLNSADIQTATFKLIQALFGEYGLLVLLPDNPALKAVMQPVFEDDLFHQAASAVVEKTIGKLSAHYKVQASPREINLFYLADNRRSRIVAKDGQFTVLGDSIHPSIHFTAEEIRIELTKHPERFSPNVILRGLFQETILPNIAFIGGGGEIAYWLELKDLFDHYKVPFPALVLRNSFMIIETEWKQRIDQLKLKPESLFLAEHVLQEMVVAQHTKDRYTIEEEKQQVQSIYMLLGQMAAGIDSTLVAHTEALQAQSLKRLDGLEKKMLRAEKRKFETENKRLHHVKQHLFPGNGLQERTDNILPYYAKYGKAIIDLLLQTSLSLEQQFTILEMKD